MTYLHHQSAAVKKKAGGQIPCSCSYGKAYQQQLKHTTRLLLATDKLTPPHGVCSKACCFTAVCRPCFKPRLCDETNERCVRLFQCVPHRRKKERKKESEGARGMWFKTVHLPRARVQTRTGRDPPTRQHQMVKMR